VNIATICGTTGPIFELPADRRLDGCEDLSGVKIGFIVQTISVSANMPLPVAP
jgi:hypothetical protein